MVIAAHASGQMPVSYSLDVGVMEDGRTALVECNDGWALGYYKGDLRPLDYFKMLDARWQELILNGRHKTVNVSVEENLNNK
jgi:hypothetical protein